MNIQEAKDILLLYRPDTTDKDDPQIAAALELAKSNAELSSWLNQQVAMKNAITRKFRTITPPVGLREQIISEHAAEANSRRRPINKPILIAVGTFVVAILLFAVWWAQRPSLNEFAIYQSSMAGYAMSGYSMESPMNNFADIQEYLAKRQAPSDYVIPASLKKIEPTGCVVVEWERSKISLICFHTGANSKKSDLWLFVANLAAVKHPPMSNTPLFAQVGRLSTATWTQDGKLYLLGKEGDQAALAKLL